VQRGEIKPGNLNSTTEDRILFTKKNSRAELKPRFAPNGRGHNFAAARKQKSEFISSSLVNKWFWPYALLGGRAFVVPAVLIHKKAIIAKNRVVSESKRF
jgi:hypothetical protein